MQRASPQVEADVASVSQQSLLVDTKRKQRREAAGAELLSSRSVPTNSVSNVANSLTSFRWVVPTQGEVVLKIWFYSELPGTFAQTFNFELMGTRRLYQLACRGLCSYPSICRDHMSVCIAAMATVAFSTDLWWRLSLFNASDHRQSSCVYTLLFAQVVYRVLFPQDSFSHLQEG